MPTFKNPKPVRATDHGRKLDRKPKAWNRIPAEKETAARQMLADGINQAAIKSRLQISNSTLARIVAEMKPGGTARHPPRVSPTHCTGDSWCRCVYCGAQAEVARKLEAKRARLAKERRT